MTDKQIIIDGINVSGCKYYLFREQQPKGERCCGMGLVDCNNNDCLYKKYKRKEQEFERLSSLIRETETYSDVCCECRDEILTYPTIAGRTDYTQIEVEERSLKKIIQQLDQLKAENEKLKNNITSFDYLNSLTDEQVAVLYTASIDELAIRGHKAKYNTEVSLLTRYQQALTEIKEIAEQGVMFEQILQKINEVNNDR